METRIKGNITCLKHQIEQKGKSMYRILIVEDNMGIAEAIKEQAKAMGARS